MPAKDAFCNESNKRFKRLADDAWAVKWDKTLCINPPSHLLGEVVQKIKEDRTQAILVVPLWDWKPWWKDVLAMTVDSIRTPGTTLVPCDSGRGLPSLFWSMEVSSLTDLVHQTMGQNQVLTMVRIQIRIFPIFLEGGDTVPNLESGMSDCSQTPIRSDPSRISHLIKGKKFRKKVKFRQFYEKPKFEAILDPFVCEDVEDAQPVRAFMTYPQDRVEPSLCQSLKQGLLPAGSRDLAKICSTVVAGEQVESQLCNE